LAIVVPFVEDCFAKTTFADSHGGRFLPYAASRIIHHSQGRDHEGGFSAYGNAIDAGMQFSPTYNNWAVFVTGSNGQASSPTRFQCNQTVSIEFYPLSSQNLSVFVTGYTIYGNYSLISESYAVAQSLGWSPYCGGCVVKRVSSLAQRNFLNFTDGSWSGIDVYANPLIAWNNSLVGYWNGARARTDPRGNSFSGVTSAVLLSHAA